MNPKSLITIVYKNGTSNEVGTPKSKADLLAIINSEPNAPGKKRWEIPLTGGKERKTKDNKIARTVEESLFFDVADIYFFSIEELEIVDNFAIGITK